MGGTCLDGASHRLRAQRRPRRVPLVVAHAAGARQFSRGGLPAGCDGLHRGGAARPQRIALVCSLLSGGALSREASRLWPTLPVQAALLAASVAEFLGFDWSFPPAEAATEEPPQLAVSGAAAQRDDDCGRRRPLANPFRRPFSSMGKDNRLPSYSNGFLVSLVVRQNQSGTAAPAADAELPAVDDRA